MATNVVKFRPTDAGLAACTCADGLGWSLDGAPGPDGLPTMRRCIGCVEKNIVRQFGEEPRTWLNWQPRPELELAVEQLRSWPNAWRSDRLWGCLLHAPDEQGNYGAGKSHAAQATAHEFAAMGLMVRYVMWVEYLSGLRSQFGEDGTRATPLAEFDGLLIMDDLGAEQQSAWKQECVKLVTDLRYRRRLPTLIATNLDVPVIEKRYPGLYSRCHEGLVIPWWAPDWRQI
jgi:hypothetical protein